MKRRYRLSVADADRATGKRIEWATVDVGAAWLPTTTAQLLARAIAANKGLECKPYLLEGEES